MDTASNTNDAPVWVTPSNPKGDLPFPRLRGAAQQLREIASSFRSRFAAQPSRIPKRLSFMWGFRPGDVPLSRQATDLILRWREMNPGWSCQVQGPDVTAPLADAFGQPYGHYVYGAQRADVGRVLLMKSQGGVYCDADMLPIRPLDELLAPYANAGVVLAVEVWATRRWARKSARRNAIREAHPESLRRVANYFLASVPGHPFWDEVLELQRLRAHLPVHGEYDILYTTGPDIITEAALHTKHDDVVVMSRSRANRYFKHLAAGSWRPEVRRRTRTD